LARGVRQRGAKGDDGLIGLAGVEGCLASCGPALSEFLAMGGEGTEEKQGDEEEDNRHKHQAKEGEGVAKDQPSLHARVFFCLHCHIAVWKS